MRTLYLTLSILFMSTLSAGCADQNSASGNLAQKLLAQKTFTISSDSYANAACSLSAGSSVSSLEASTITVTFTENQFTVSSSLEKVSGTWQMIDSNTLQLTVDGQITTVDVAINGSVLIISEPSGSADCGSSNSIPYSPAPSIGPSSSDTSAYELPGNAPSETTPSKNTPTMSAPSVMTDPLDVIPVWVARGTWCRDLGPDAHIITSTFIFDSTDKQIYATNHDGDYIQLEDWNFSDFDDTTQTFNYVGNLMSVTGNTMTATYGPYTTTYKWISAEAVECPVK